MDALWWFKDQSILGMARPGFNRTHWADLSLEEGILLGWLGQFSSGTYSLTSLRQHIDTYAPQVFSFFNQSEESGRKAMDTFRSSSGIVAVADRLMARMESFADFCIDAGSDDDFDESSGENSGVIRLKTSRERVRWEADRLADMGVRRIVCLTEEHHDREYLQNRFAVHHFEIRDLHAPTRDQAVALAEIIKRTQERNEILAVHCLAGIGRTSTMLMAAHLWLGETYEVLLDELARRNPTFTFSDSQREFVDSFRRDVP